MAKYGKILNVFYTDEYCGSVSDEQGNFVVDIKDYAKSFGLIYQNLVHLRIDMETGVVLNWTELKKDQIVDLIERNS